MNVGKARLRGKVVEVTGSRWLDDLESRVAALEVATAENRVLAEPLATVVAGIERAVAEMLERSHQRSVES